MFAGDLCSFLRFAVEAMDPVRLMIIDEVDDRADRPRDGIGPIDELDIARDVHDRRDIEDAEHAPDAQHDHHRHAADRRDRVRIGQQEIEQRDRPCLLRGQRDDLRRLTEQRCQLRHQDPHGHADQLCQRDRAQDAEPCALFRPRVFARAEVLARIGGQGHGEARDRQESEALQLGVGAVGRHGDLAEGVDVRLDDDVCQPDDRILHAGRQTVAHDLTEHLAIKAQHPPDDVERRRLFGKMDQAEDHADGL